MHAVGGAAPPPQIAAVPANLHAWLGSGSDDPNSILACVNRARNNARTGALKLTAARRRRLIEARGGRCQRCGIDGGERHLEVHHRLGVFRGGDDSPANLEVLCFACHHHVRPCAGGCGRWAKLPASLCRSCQTERRLAQLGSRLGRRE